MKTRSLRGGDDRQSASGGETLTNLRVPCKLAKVLTSPMVASRSPCGPVAPRRCSSRSDPEPSVRHAATGSRRFFAPAAHLGSGVIVGDTPEVRAASIAAFAAEVPLGRKGTPEDVALMALYLVSDESAYVTGAEFVIDGGILAGSAARRLTPRPPPQP